MCSDPGFIWDLAPQITSFYCVQLWRSETGRAKDGVTELDGGSSEAEPYAGEAEGEAGRCVDINRGV